MQPATGTESTVGIVVNALQAASKMPGTEIDADTPFDALGLDSLDVVSVLSAIETCLGIYVRSLHMPAFDRVRDLVGYIDRVAPRGA